MSRKPKADGMSIDQLRKRLEELEAADEKRKRAGRGRTNAKSKPKDKGKHKGYASGLELRFVEEMLLKWVAAGEVIWWRYEPETYHLAGSGTSVKPDFKIQRPDGSMEIIEVKGFWHEDAWIKMKILAYEFPYPVYVVRYGRQSGLIIRPIEEDSMARVP